MQARIQLTHACDVMICKPHAVIKFGHICDWCRVHMGQKDTCWRYEIMQDLTHAWHVRFWFPSPYACTQFQLTWC